MDLKMYKETISDLNEYILQKSLKHFISIKGGIKVFRDENVEHIIQVTRSRSKAHSLIRVKTSRGRVNAWRLP